MKTPFLNKKQNKTLNKKKIIKHSHKTIAKKTRRKSQRKLSGGNAKSGSNRKFVNVRVSLPSGNVMDIQGDPSSNIEETVSQLKQDSKTVSKTDENNNFVISKEEMEKLETMINNMNTKLDSLINYQKTSATVATSNIAGESKDRDLTEQSARLGEENVVNSTEEPTQPTQPTQPTLQNNMTDEERAIEDREFEDKLRLPSSTTNNTTQPENQGIPDNVPQTDGKEKPNENDVSASTSAFGDIDD